MANDEGKPNIRWHLIKRGQALPPGTVLTDEEWIEWGKQRGPTPYQIEQRKKLETVPPRSRVEEWMMKELGYIVRRGYVLKSNPGNAELTLVSDMTADTATCERVLLMYRVTLPSECVSLSEPV